MIPEDAIEKPLKRFILIMFYNQLNVVRNDGKQDARLRKPRRPSLIDLLRHKVLQAARLSSGESKLWEQFS